MSAKQGNGNLQGKKKIQAICNKINKATAYQYKGESSKGQMIQFQDEKILN